MQEPCLGPGKTTQLALAQISKEKQHLRQQQKRQWLGQQSAAGVRFSSRAATAFWVFQSVRRLSGLTATALVAMLPRLARSSLVLPVGCLADKLARSAALHHAFRESPR